MATYSAHWNIARGHFIFLSGEFIQLNKHTYICIYIYVCVLTYVFVCMHVCILYIYIYLITSNKGFTALITTKSKHASTLDENNQLPCIPK